MPKVEDRKESIPLTLKPYFFHRVQLSWEGMGEAVGECPFCNREKKFYVSQDRGLYSCKVCGKEGNAYTFIRQVHILSAEQISLYELEEVGEERRIRPATLKLWGLCKSIIDGEWILPAYGIKGDINNLYRWTPMKGKRRLLSTSTIDHCLFGMQFWDATKKEVILCEGGWNPMSIQEQMKSTILEKSHNVLGVPGCETFKDSWIKQFKGKNVTIIFDNDHEKEKNGKVIPPGGYNGTLSATRKLKGTAAKIKCVIWGQEGYDSELPDGYDPRDYLNA